MHVYCLYKKNNHLTLKITRSNFENNQYTNIKLNVPFYKKKEIEQKKT